MYGDCFSERKELVLLVGNFSVLRVGAFKYYIDDNVVSRVGIEITEDLNYYRTKEKRYVVNPADVFFRPLPANKCIISGIDIFLLEMIFYKIKDSIWWNIYSFFIIDNRNTANSCQNVYRVLRTAWKFDILFVIYVCSDSHFNVHLYTHNPFTNYAPNIWKLMEIRKQKNNHLFYIFELVRRGNCK